MTWDSHRLPTRSRPCSRCRQIAPVAPEVVHLAAVVAVDPPPVVVVARPAVVLLAPAVPLVSSVVVVFVVVVAVLVLAPHAHVVLPTEAIDCKQSGHIHLPDSHVHRTRPTMRHTHHWQTSAHREHLDFLYEDR